MKVRGGYNFYKFKELSKEVQQKLLDDANLEKIFDYTYEELIPEMIEEVEEEYKVLTNTFLSYSERWWEIEAHPCGYVDFKNLEKCDKYYSKFSNHEQAVLRKMIYKNKIFPQFHMCCSDWSYKSASLQRMKSDIYINAFSELSIEERNIIKKLNLILNCIEYDFISLIKKRGYEIFNREEISMYEIQKNYESENTYFWENGNVYHGECDDFFEKRERERGNKNDNI